MSRQLVSVSEDCPVEKIAQEHDYEEIAVKVVDAEEGATRKGLPMLTKAIQTDEFQLPQKELKYLSSQISCMYLKTTKEHPRSSQIDVKCFHKLNAVSCDPLYHFSTQLRKEDGQRTRLCAGYSPNPPRKGIKAKSSIIKGHIFLDRSVDLGSLPATRFPPLPHSKVNLVTMKANTTDADMFRENSESAGDTVLQRECLLEMKRALPDLLSPVGK